jgi:ribonuclease Z
MLLNLDALVLTHGHVDHIGGVPALLQGCRLLGRDKPLAVHLPAEMIAPLRSWISALYLTEEAMGFPVSWHAWEPGRSVSFGNGIAVTPHSNDHLRACYAGKPGADADRPCESFSLEITHGSFRAVFSGDLASPGELAPLLGRPISVLVSELSHFGAEELAEVLRPATLHALCLVHLAEEYALDRDVVRALLEQLLPQVPDVFLPEDGEVLDF